MSVSSLPGPYRYAVTLPLAFIVRWLLTGSYVAVYAETDDAITVSRSAAS
jgi:hypothetical protein